MGSVKSSRGKVQITNGHGDGEHVHDCQDENEKVSKRSTREDKTEKQYQQQDYKHRERKKQKNKKKDTTGFGGITSCLSGKDDSKPEKDKTMLKKLPSGKVNGHGDGEHVHDCQDENKKVSKKSTREDKTEKQYQQQDYKHRERKKQKNKNKIRLDDSKPEKDKKMFKIRLKQRSIYYFSVISGNTLGSHELFLQKIHEHIPFLRKVSTVDQSDVILVFCPIVSRVGTDIKAALKQLSNVADSKPAVLVVLYNTFDPENIVPDSSRYVSRENMIAMDCLFYEGLGLLQCGRNSEAVRRAAEWIKTMPSSKSIMCYRSGACSGHFPDNAGAPDRKEKRRNTMTLFLKVKYVRLHGTTTRTAQDDFISRLHKQTSLLQPLKKVDDVKDCDVAIYFCCIVSRVETDLEAELKKLSCVPATKPVVLVVLHHTFDPHCTVPDSSRCVSREKTITVDCLFSEDQGLLSCKKNDEAFRKTAQWIRAQKQTSAARGKSKNSTEEGLRQPLLQSSTITSPEQNESEPSRCCVSCCMLQAGSYYPSCCIC